MAAPLRHVTLLPRQLLHLRSCCAKLRQLSLVHAMCTPQLSFQLRRAKASRSSEPVRPALTIKNCCLHMLKIQRRVLYFHDSCGVHICSQGEFGYKYHLNNRRTPTSSRRNASSSNFFMPLENSTSTRRFQFALITSKRASRLGWLLDPFWALPLVAHLYGTQQAALARPDIAAYSIRKIEQSWVGYFRLGSHE